MKQLLRYVLFLAVGYLCLSLESPLLTSFHVRMYAPDPTLAAVVYCAAAMNLVPGIVMAGLFGLVRDGFSSGVPLGMYVEIYSLIFLCCHALSRRIDYRSVLLITVVTMAASLLSSTLFFVFSAIFDRDFDQFDLVFRLALPQALISSPMGPIVGGVLGYLDGRFFQAEKEGLLR